MVKQALIKDIITLPTRFYQENVSIYSLLEKTGYFDLHEQVSVKDIYEGILESRSIISTWLNWAENKRTISGWYFKYLENGRYKVGYIGDGELQETKEYSSKVEACAVYIKKEIEDIRKNNPF